MGEGATVWMGVGYFILLSPIIILFIVFALSLVGPLWAPFGALICARIAGKRGLNVWRYAGAGALYSLLLFWPWVYLVLRMKDRSLHRGLIVLFYVVVYFTWLSAIGILIYGGLYNHPGLAQVANLSNPWMWIGSSILTIAGAGIALWWVSLTRMNRRYKYVDSRESNDLRASTLPVFVYLAPVAGAIAWILAVMLSIYGQELLPIGITITTPHPNYEPPPRF